MHSHCIIDNSFWLLGDGKSINFWLFDWSGVPLVNLFNIPPHIHQNLKSTTVNEYIVDYEWNIPDSLQELYPTLLQHVNKVMIPAEFKEDQFIWKHTTSGDLSLKDAFSFSSITGQQKHWAKIIRSTDMPPSKSFMFWRLIYRKMPVETQSGAPVSEELCTRNVLYLKKILKVIISFV